MKKMLVGAICCLLLVVDVWAGEVALEPFDTRNAPQSFVFFYYEFETQFMIVKKNLSVLWDYRIKILQGSSRRGSSAEFADVIGVSFNERMPADSETITLKELNDMTIPELRLTVSIFLRRIIGKIRFLDGGLPV